MDFPQTFDIRQNLASVLEQIRLDIDANVRKLTLIASEAEMHGLHVTEALADEAAEIVVDFAEAFSRAYKPPVEVEIELLMDELTRKAIQDTTLDEDEDDEPEPPVMAVVEPYVPVGPTLSDAAFKALLGLK